jgi:hypothetical protein
MTLSGLTLKIEMSKKKKKKHEPPKKHRKYILIEGYVLNEKTGELEPYYKKVYPKHKV